MWAVFVIFLRLLGFRSTTSETALEVQIYLSYLYQSSLPDASLNRNTIAAIHHASQKHSHTCIRKRGPNEVNAGLG